MTDRKLWAEELCDNLILRNAVQLLLLSSQLEAAEKERENSVECDYGTNSQLIKLRVN